MGKYYVQSGNLHHVIDGPCPRQAALNAIRHVQQTDATICLSNIMKVGELGFEHVRPMDLLFSTELILEELGVLHEFCAEEND